MAKNKTTALEQPAATHIAAQKPAQQLDQTAQQLSSSTQEQTAQPVQQLAQTAQQLPQSEPEPQKSEPRELSFEQRVILKAKMRNAVRAAVIFQDALISIVNPVEKDLNPDRA